MKQIILALLITTLSTVELIGQQIFSPDDKISLTFSLLEDGSVTYQLDYKNNEVVKISKLGFELKNDSIDLKSGFTIVNTENLTFDEIWKPVWGEESEIRNHYNELFVSLLQKSTQRVLNIRFRVFIVFIWISCTLNQSSNWSAIIFLYCSKIGLYFLNKTQMKIFNI